MCGKNDLLTFALFSVEGSPPRVREEPFPRTDKSRIARITPACAGRTAILLPIKRLSRDHPRVCGKNDLLTFALFSVEGSPPRVREEPFPRTDKSRIARITPACAGRTAILLPIKRLSRDHPRVCGKNDLLTFALFSVEGSPPRVREEQCRKGKK